MTLQPQSVPNSEPLPVVVEICEDLHPSAPGRDPPLPGLELGLGVVAAPAAVPVVEADESPVRGQLAGLERTLGMVADDEGDAVATQQLIRLGAEPALVAELEAVASGRQLLERRGQELVVAVEVRRELPQDGPELGRV